MKVDFLFSFFFPFFFSVPFSFWPIFRAAPFPPLAVLPAAASGKILRPTSSTGEKGRKRKEKKGRPSVAERAVSLKRCKCRTGYEGREGGGREEWRKARTDRKWPPLTQRDQKLVSPDTRKRHAAPRRAER